MINNLLAMLDNELIKNHKKEFIWKIPDDVLENEAELDKLLDTLNDYDFKEFNYSFNYMCGIIIFWLKKE